MPGHYDRMIAKYMQLAPLVKQTSHTNVNPMTSVKTSEEKGYWKLYDFPTAIGLIVMG